MSFVINKNFLNMSDKELLDSLKVDMGGLSDKKVLKNILKYGDNSFKNYKPKLYFSTAKPKYYKAKFLYYFIVIIFAILDDNLFVLSIILAIIIIEVVNLFSVNNKIEENISKSLKINKIKVKRNGKLKYVNTEDLTVGDIVYYEKNIIIPADIRLLKIESMTVIKSHYTSNQSYEIKNLENPHNKLSLENYVFTGDEIIEGSGYGVIFQVGMLTRLGKILSLKQIIQKHVSNFSDIRAKTSQLIMALAILLCFGFYFLNLNFLKFDDYTLDNIILSILIIAIPFSFLINFKNLFKNGSKTMSSETDQSLSETDLLISSYDNLFLSDEKEYISKLYTGYTEYNPSDFKLLNSKKTQLRMFYNSLYYSSQPKILSDYYNDKSNLRFNESYYSNTVHRFINSLELESEQTFFNSNEIDFITLEHNINISIVRDNKKIICYIQAPADLLINKIKDIQDNETIRPFNKLDFKYFDSIIQNSESIVLGYAYKEFNLQKKRFKTSEILSELTYLGQIEINDMIESKNIESLYRARNHNIKLITFCRNIYQSQNLKNIILQSKKNNPIKTKTIVGNNLSYIDQYLNDDVDHLIIIENNSEIKFEIIRRLNEMGTTISYVGESIEDLPALKLVSNGIVSNDNSLKELSIKYLINIDQTNLYQLINLIIESKKKVLNIVKIYYSLFTNSIAALILIIVGILTIKFFNLPTAITPSLIIIYILIGQVIPNRSLLKDKHYNQELK